MSLLSQLCQETLQRICFTLEAIYERQQFNIENIRSLIENRDSLVDAQLAVDSLLSSVEYQRTAEEYIRTASRENTICLNVLIDALKERED